MGRRVMLVTAVIAALSLGAVGVGRASAATVTEIPGGGWVLNPFSVTGGAKTTFMEGPATPPEGVGSLQLNVTAPLVPALIDYPLGAPVPLVSVTGSWSTYVETGQEAGSAGVEARREAQRVSRRLNAVTFEPRNQARDAGDLANVDHQ